jgi:RNA polymerase sigma factor (sigma-70 family)
MPTDPIHAVLQHLDRAAGLHDEAGLADGQRLARFVEHRDEAAFAEIVRRHGPMVLGVCLRVLRNRQDAEDAFQATFLVLARKAASIASRSALANWLYGVAYNTALKGRAANARRRAREKQVKEVPEPAGAEPDTPGDDLQALLDQELSRLPDKYRAPIVLCDLEGKTRKEAARQLGCPEGSLSSRLARGRALLAKRLARRGLPVTGGTSVTVLSGGVAPAGMPASLVTATIEAALLFAAGRAATGVVSARVIALAEGVVKAMLLTKLKAVTAVVLLTALACFGVGVWAHATSADGRIQTVAAEEKKGKEARPADQVDAQLRIAKLEKQVAALSKEVEALRKDARPRAAAKASRGEVKIFALRNANADESAKVLKDLFVGDEKRLPKIRIAAHKGTNSVLLWGGTREDLEMVEAVLTRLDQLEQAVGPRRFEKEKRFEKKKDE